MKNKRIYVAGHNGMVGSAIVRKLKILGCDFVITKTRNELDLTNQHAVANFFKQEKIDSVILAAAKVGGIHANNTYPADFIYQNLMIETNVIHNAYLAGVERLLFLGSSCIYPKYAEQPMKEDALLTGKLEPTNEPYAIAKIAGIKLCESYNRQYGTDFRSVMPTNLYGPGDNFHTKNSHVIPALIDRFHKAKLSNDPVVSVWGTGNAMREFLHVDDMADASIFIMNLTQQVYKEKTGPMLSHVNVGSGIDFTIRELVEIIVKVTGYQGEILFDTTKSDGSPRKLMSTTLIKGLGWAAKTTLEQGISKTYDWFLANQNVFRR
jgi:GDP-L-fucose synthase